MTIEDFLEILEQRDLVPPSIAEQLRAKIDTGDRRITPQSLLKYMVQKEFITQRQAKQLLETTLTVSPSAESSILGIAATPKVPTADKSLSKPPEEDIPTIMPVDRDLPEDEDSGGLVTDEGSFVGRPDLFGEQPASLIAESLSRAGVGDPTLTEAIQESNIDPQIQKQKRSKKASQKSRRSKNEWDSSLLLLGGGGLILLILVGVIIGYLLGRENADAVLSEASEFFAGGSYTQAIKQYERFVENHPQHPEFSAAKVKLGMARLWKASSGTSDYGEALDTAQRVLANIEDESEFNSAQRDLASLLPKIAQGLADQAERATEPDKIQHLVKQANSALSFCSNTKYVPSRFRDKVLLSEIGQTLERVERSRAQNASLSKAITEMQAAIGSHDTAQAYLIHDSLLDEHPGLINNEQLAAQVIEISAAESSVVKFVAETTPATTEPRPTKVVAELALANRSGPVAATAAGVVAVRVSGAIYGLSAQDGSLLWRRFVGIAPQLTPIALPSGDLLAVDQQHHELQKLAGTTGKLIWRQPFETAVARPVLLGEQVLVAESAGKLHVVDVTTGQRNGYVQFAQPLSAPPAVDAESRRIYIAGEHSSLYTLSADDFSCLGVFFLNHAKGSVTTPPVRLLNKVIVAVAKGLSTSHLEVLNTTDDGIPNQIAVQRRLAGLVNTPLLFEGRRLVALTSQGQVAVYDVGSGVGDEALTPLASREPESGTPLARFGLLNDGYAWVGGRNLNKLAILPTSDRLSVSTIDRDYLGDTFDHPLQTSNGFLIHVRRPAHRAGVIVAAMEMDSGRPQWETELATPLAGPPAADAAGMQISAISSSGSAYLIDRDAMRQRVLNRAEQVTTDRKLPSLSHSLDLGQGRLVAAADKGQMLLHFRPDLPRKSLHTIPLVGPLSCPPVAWDEGFVVATQVGQVFLYDSEDGQQWGSPFQPPLAPGVTYDWKSPAVYGSGAESQLVLSDGRKKVYLLSRSLSPQPYLSATAEVDLSSSSLNTGFAILGDLAVAGTAAGSLTVFELPTLAPQPSVELQAQVTWGPYTVGQQVVLATDSDELICLDGQATVVWRQALTHGPPTGQPVTHDDAFVLLWQQGGLSRLLPSSGEEAAYVPLPQPVVAGPALFGQRLVVSSYDGTLLIVDRP